MRDLGLLIQQHGIRSATLCLSHGHYDHVIGLPFFLPLWNPEFNLHIFAGRPYPYENMRDFMERCLFAPPLFPVPLRDLKATLHFTDIEAGQTFELMHQVHLKTIALNHPGGSIGYRLEAGQRSVCYITDHDHADTAITAQLTEFVYGTDVLIYDATFTDEEYPLYKGWGHSTWQEGVRLLQNAGAKQLALYHHSPEHTDEVLAHIEKTARNLAQNVCIARQGMTICIE